jgi:transcriptional regulator with XRE-family HTH domain
MALVDDVRDARRLPGPSMRREIRRAAGVSQQRLADELGVHVQTVIRWERDAEPREINRARYARLLAELSGAIAS